MSFFVACSSSLFSASVSRLANVELQLIMQYLQCKELFQFARCNHHLLAVADDPFAWCKMNPMKLDRIPSMNLKSTRTDDAPSKSFLVPSVSANPSPFSLSHPLRHLSIALTWSPPADLKVGVNTLLTFSSLIHLHELIIPVMPRTSALLWLRLFIHKSMKRLHIVSLQSANGALLKLICAFPELHTLSIIDSFSNSSDSDPLPSAPSLTSLQLNNRWQQEGSMLNVMQCSHLQHLSFGFAPLAGNGWKTFFSSPHMQQLRSLTFTNVFIANSGLTPSALDMQNAFASLIHLHSLSLILHDSIDELLPHLVHAPSLRQLTLQPVCSIYLQSLSHPVLMNLLTSSPNLHVTLLLYSVLAQPTWDEKESAQQFRTIFAADAMMEVESQFTLESNLD